MSATVRLLERLGLAGSVRRVWWGLRGGNGTVPAVVVRSLRSRRLVDLAERINWTTCTMSADGVAGWLSWKEGRTLYALARELDGPFLEIGSWAGLSTCYFAAAIRDGGTRKRFVTAELNPTLENFQPHDSKIGFFYPAESTAPRFVMSQENFDAQVKPVVAAPGGVAGALTRNLDRLGLSPYVEVCLGPFEKVAPRLHYQCVFADIMHDPEVIAQNAPAVREFLSPGTILACHDADARNEACLRRVFSVGESFVVDSLFIGEIV